VTGEQLAGAGSRRMRLAWRVLWFLAYHSVLLWAVVSASNRAGRTVGFGFWVLGFVLGFVLVLQASCRLPAFYHGISMFVLLPGLTLLGPLALAPAYEQAVMSPQTVTVLSQSSHTVSDIVSNLAYGRRYSYTDVRVRLSDGSVRDGIIRPARTVTVGSSIRLRVDRLHLVRPQSNSGSGAPVAAVIGVLLLVLAEVELVSALVRPEGGSFIADTSRKSPRADASLAD
jgi:hypothetical protein